MNNYSLVPSTKFKKDLKAYIKYPKKIEAIKNCLDLLSAGGYEKIPQKMKPHKLSGNYKDCWECHIQPDLLIIWEQQEEPEKEIYLIRLGSHSDLF